MCQKFLVASTAGQSSLTASAKRKRLSFFSPIYFLFFKASGSEPGAKEKAWNVTADVSAEKAEKGEE